MQLLSYKFRETKDWLNPHNNENEVPQNLENKLTSLHFLKAFLSGLIWANMPVSGFSGLICLDGGYFRESLFREYKNKLDKSEKVEKM